MILDGCEPLKTLTREDQTHLPHKERCDDFTPKLRHQAHVGNWFCSSSQVLVYFRAQLVWDGKGKTD